LGRVSVGIGEERRKREPVPEITAIIPDGNTGEGRRRKATGHPSVGGTGRPGPEGTTVYRDPLTGPRGSVADFEEHLDCPMMAPMAVATVAGDSAAHGSSPPQKFPSRYLVIVETVVWTGTPPLTAGRAILWILTGRHSRGAGGRASLCSALPSGTGRHSRFEVSRRRWPPQDSERQSRPR